jgi:hypothetical protein
VRDLEAALDGPLDLVATSALLDLVSYSWLKRLAIEVVVRGLPFYAALSYNGQVTFEPSDLLDAPITAVSNHHVAARDWDSARMREQSRCSKPWVILSGAPRPTGMRPHDQDMLAARVHGWPGTALGGATVAARIASRLTHRRDALSHENRQFASVASMSWLPRSPGAECSDRNRTTRRHPIGESSLVRATLLARARSAED